MGGEEGSGVLGVETVRERVERQCGALPSSLFTSLSCSACHAVLLLFWKP